AYEKIYLVFPNWWGDLPQPLYTFFDEYDFSGKQINVFVTHGGSSFSGTISTIKKMEPGATVKEGVSLRDSKVSSSEQEITSWVKSNR
ncbi:MAG: flavodoxin, partial [Clostridia bacterium]|nr:flavodoxin [Clostridia bacterium]